MVVRHPIRSELDDESIDRLFHALADRTRRDIVERTMTVDTSVSALAGSYAMSFAAVQKHVAVLERAGLVVKQRHGREQLVRTDIEAIRRARHLLDHFETVWRGRIDRIDELLADPVGTAGSPGDVLTTTHHPTIEKEANEP